MPRDFPWTLDVIIDDFVRVMDTLGIGRFHLVGAKIGGTIARALTARRPERVITLTVVGTPPPMREGAAERAPELAEEFDRDGVEHWARRTMAGRLGSDFPAEGVEWWIKFMGRTAVSTQIGFMKTIACADIRADLPKITCPTLVITTDGSGLASVEETQAWQLQIANSRLVDYPATPTMSRRAMPSAVQRPHSTSSPKTETADRRSANLSFIDPCCGRRIVSIVAPSGMGKV
ncbi:MAG: alpha/beta fold hydrolase, partial [Acetobacteraceae bacterium]|nr:alpha/beta fold hydrolase [Acetobacteraceae bacterium]